MNNWKGSFEMYQNSELAICLIETHGLEKSDYYVHVLGQFYFHGKKILCALSDWIKF